VSILKQLNLELTGVLTGGLDSLIRIEDGRGGSGAGTIWHPDGLVLTNAHVVRGRGATVVLKDGRRLKANLIGRDDKRDLAALSLPQAGLPSIELGAVSLPEVGSWVMALGHPWGVQGAATAGIVIGIGPAFPEAPRNGREWIHSSLHYRPGHSGGPLLDTQGKLIGINTIMAGPMVGVAVPLREVTAFLNEALN
jgi:serine protease Do